ncbi:MAG: YfhO family protein [Bacteroidota bacterium]
MKSLKISSILPYIISIIIFYLATLSYFYPELIENKSLGQTDIVQFEGMSKRSVDYKKANDGEQALWNDAMFSGLPDYLIATGTPEVALQTIKKFTRGLLNKKTSAHLLFMHMFCFWILMLSFRVRPWLALVGALAFAFSSYNIINIEAGHFTKSWAIAFAALVLSGVHLVFRKKYLLGFAILCLGLALQLGALHYQITFYLIFVCLAYSISELVYAIREKQIAVFAKQAGIMIAAIALAASTAVARLWMVQEYTPYSMRGEKQLSTVGKNNENTQKEEGLTKEYAYQWSQGKMETFTLLIPYFYGGSSGEALQEGSNVYDAIARAFGKQQADKLVGIGPVLPLYHGDQTFTGGPLYMGAIVCFLFILAMLVLPDRMRWWMLAATIISMMFAWGKNLAFFNYFLFDNIPGFNKFRSVSMALSMTMMIMPLAGIVTVQKLLTTPLNDALKKKIYIALAATGGIALLFAIFGGMGSFSTPKDTSFPQRLGINDATVADNLIDALRDDRLAYLRKDAFRSAILIVLAGAVIYFAMLGKLTEKLTILVLGALMIGDVWLVGKRYLYPEQFKKNAVKQAHSKSAADDFILQDKELHYRVFSLGSFSQEAQTSYYHRSIGGYFAAKMMRYNDLIEKRLFPEQNTMIESLRSGKLPDFSQTPTLNMLNAKYIKYGDDAKQVIRNNAALGNAWFVQEVAKVNSPDEAIASLDNFNPAQEAILNTANFKIDKTNFAVDSTASIQLTSYSPRRITYQSSNKQDGLAVFSEIYYPEGWSATIDGKEIEILSVNYVLRALEIPSGKHEIKFSFNPKSYTVGSKISSTGGYLVVLTTIISLCFTTFKALKE